MDTSSSHRAHSPTIKFTTQEVRHLRTNLRHILPSSRIQFEIRDGLQEIILRQNSMKQIDLFPAATTCRHGDVESTTSLNTAEWVVQRTKTL